MTPDFTSPRPNWRRTEVNGAVIYLPEGISHVNGRWRVTVNNEPKYHPDLRCAWADYTARWPTRRRTLGFHGPVKRIDTGVLGVTIKCELQPTRNYCGVTILAQQSCDVGYRQRSAGYCSVDNLTQQWLDDTLIKATGLRWYSLHQKWAGQLKTPLGVEDVPSEVFPAAPVRRVPLDEVYALVDARIAAARAAGREVKGTKRLAL